jgi:hypothetical protein
VAYFAFMDHSQQEFVFELTDPSKIEEARNILSGKTTDRVHVMGRIKKIRKDYNPNFSYHLDPSTITFFTMAIEVCDATMSYVEDHLDEACGAFLPGCFWCPWTSRLVREVEAAPTT